MIEPDPAYFQSRPSVAGAGYDPLATSASNLGPENYDLIAAIKERRAAAAQDRWRLAVRGAAGRLAG